MSKLYPSMKKDELELLVELNSSKDLKDLAKQFGMSDVDIKKELG